MRGARSIVVLTATLLLALAIGAAADDIRLLETRTVNDQTIIIDLSWTLTSQHDADVVLLLRPLPRTATRELEVTPMFLPVVGGETYRTAGFRVHHTGADALGIRAFAAGFAETGEGLQRPFFTRQLDVITSFPAQQVGAVTTMAPQTSVGSGVDPERLARLRALLQRMTQQGRSPQETMRSGIVRRWLMLNAAVNQEDAATADLEVAENMASYEPPTGDAEGVIEVGPAPTEHPAGSDGAERVPELRVTSIEAHQRGLYVINFAYRVADVVGRVPLTFDVEFKGSANQWVTQQPFLHQYPERDYSGNGFITLWIDSPDAPLSLGQAEVRLRARGKQGAVLSSVRIRPGFSWYKAYDAITYQNLVDYCAGPDAVRRDSIGLNEGDFSLAEYFHGRYDQEPPMLVFKTAGGIYCRGLFMPHRGGQGLEGVWLVDLDCFDAATAPWDAGYLDGHLPADPDDWLISRRSYDNGALLTAGMLFDLDRTGANCTPAEADIVVQRDANGKQYLATMNGCMMYY